MRYPPAPSIILPALAFAALTLPACVDSAASGPVLAQQREAIVRLERSSAEDLAALRSLASSVLAARAERLLTDIEHRLIAEMLDDRAQPPADAQPWLVEYAALLRAGAPADTRRAPLRTLPEVLTMHETSSAILAALDARALETASLFGEALADNAALADAAGATVDLSAASREAATELWRSAVLERIEDPAHRAAAQRLLSDVLFPSN